MVFVFQSLNMVVHQSIVSSVSEWRSQTTKICSDYKSSFTSILLFPLRLSFSISSFNGSNNNNSFLCVLLYVNLFCQSLWICLFDLRSFIFSHRSPTIVSRTFSFKFLLELIFSHAISSNFFDYLILCSRSLHNNQIKKLKIRFMKNVENI